MYEPALHDETTSYAEFADQQFEALRAAAHGLTEEQARMRPLRSALSIGGILKHVTFVYRSADEYPAEDGAPSAEGLAAFEDSFALRPEETLADTLAAFESRRAEVLEWIRSSDPDEETTTPPAPWFGRMTPAPVRTRYALCHVIEELARHAGHADIIREQIDGATSLELWLADTGRPATPFAQPWTASAGEVGEHAEARTPEPSQA